MSKSLKIIVWGPGELGAECIRMVHERADMELVGVKAFSKNKHGVDAGVLAGIGEIGVIASTSKEEILSLEADCVVVTAVFGSLFKGLDNDVIEILRSGKSVVASTTYHNMSKPNWLSYKRAPVEEFVAACKAGNSSIYGGGVHPNYISERVVIPMSKSLERVDHIRIAEAVDFSGHPVDMWEGIGELGFGRPLSEVNSDLLVAKGAEINYGDMVANMAFHLYGTPNEDVRIEYSIRGIAAKETFKIDTLVIEKGTAESVHLTQKGFIGDRCFFTNEECWFLGLDRAYRGDDLPFGNMKTNISYTIEIEGSPGTIRSQIDLGTNKSIIVTSIQALLSAIPAVCASKPGVIVDDTQWHYKLDSRVPGNS